MASTSIKIYNDTVLKQSILQGYEVQRTNDNLGRFTMGELTFTRDTGRLFIGNYTTNSTNDLDSSYVSGGILSGNKYLGFIDSKPLLHFSATGSTGWLPLSYEQDTVDTTLSNEVVQRGLFLEGSRFRNNDANGWNKKPQFMEKYGVYSGDYTFDIYNNALIVFDKNITTQAIHQPKRKIITENGKFKEILINQNGEQDLNLTVKRRTPLYNSQDVHNANYPIYGDGYVMIRILEPDGTTLGYLDRTFVHDSKVNADGSPTTTNNSKQNWSHNYLTIKNVPAEALRDAFDSSQFNNNGVIIKLQPELPGITALKGESITLPSQITLKSCQKDKWDGEVELNFSFNNPESQFVESNPNTDYILTAIPEEIQNNGQVKVVYNTTIKKQYLPDYRVNLHDGLINLATNETFLQINKQNSDTGLLELGYRPQKQSLSNPNGYSDPLNIGTLSDYVYSGTNAYSPQGGLTYTEQYDESYLTAAKERLISFDTIGNNAYNLLKQPMPICWSRSTNSSDGSSYAKLDFVVHPFVHCIKKLYTSGSVTSTTGQEQRDYTSDSQYYNTDINVLGNNSFASGQQQSNIPIIDGFSYSIIQEELYNEKVVNSSQTVKILSSTPIEATIKQEISEVLYESNRQIYYTTNDTCFPIFLDDKGFQVYKDGTWKFVPGQDPAPSAQDTPSIPEDEESLNPYIDYCVAFNDFSNFDDIEIIKPKKPTSVNDQFTSIISLKTIDSIENDESSKQFVFDSSDNEFDDFRTFFEYAYIDKVEISSNSKTPSERWVTLFDKTAKINDTAIQELKQGIYELNPMATIVVQSEGLEEEKTFSCIYENDLFFNQNLAPYVLRISYRVQGDLNQRERIYSLIGDVSYSNNVVITKNNDQYLLDAQLPIHSVIVDDTSIDAETFYNTYYDEQNLTVKLDNVNQFITFITNEIIGVEIPTNQPIYRFDESWYSNNRNQQLIDNYYYEWVNEIPLNEVDENGETIFLKITYQGNGITSVDQFDGTNKHIIKSVTKNGVNLSVDEIKEYLTNKIITIPSIISVPLSSLASTSFYVKTIPAHDKGYVFSTDVESQNRIIIPQFASSLVLQIHHYSPSKSPITIYNASDMSDLGKMIEQTDDLGNSTTVSNDIPYVFPFDLTTQGIPTLQENACMNENEKVLYYSNESDVQVIDVPLYKTTLNGVKGFSLRVTNVPCGGSDDKFLIRVIGYRV